MSAAPDTARTDLAIAARTLAALDCALVLLSTLTNAVAHTPWPQVLWLGVFRAPGAGLAAALLTPQPLASPLWVAALILLLPLAFQAWCLVLLARALRGPARPLAWFFALAALVPVFGPLLVVLLLEIQDEHTPSS